MFLDITC
jgi:DNA-directed RNA polymerase specialized sigma subunit